jgi:hypothetical protein
MGMTDKFTLIGVSGKKRHGKNTCFTFARMLLDEDDNGKPFNVKRVGFADELKRRARNDFGWDGAKDEKGRELLQRFGVGMRNIDENYWVRILERDINYEMERKRDRSEAHDVCIVTDVRFSNEAEMIRRLGGTLWRVVRTGVPVIDQHISETALDDWGPFDHIIEAGNLDELLDGVKTGLAKAGLYPL